jgi:NAD(P)H-dependent flavin oxidoreductase YrpB (nitropropane dioxygenase family)
VDDGSQSSLERSAGSNWQNAPVPIVTRFTEMFHCRHPLQQAGMGGFTSPDLAVAVARAGGLGMLSGTIGAEALSAQLDVVPSDLPVGVNFLVPFLDWAALEEASARSPLVECFWGSPDSEVIEAVHRGGAHAGWQVGSADEARAARDAGCDLIIAQGVEAGGHVRGTVGLLALLDEVRVTVDLPLVAAGGIGSGRAMAAALVAGADAVRVGTRFLAATESIAHPAYVDALISSGADDTVLTTAFGEGWPDAPHRVLKSAIAAGEALGGSQSWTPEWPSLTSVGAVEARALYAGQSVGSVRSRQPASEIVTELVTEAEYAIHLPGPSDTT